jgi:OFA family oxalate/formate antiporter-like MFS transporter
MGVFADRAGNKSALIVCLVLQIIALLWLQSANSAWMLFLFAGVYGFAFGGILIQFPLITAVRFGLTSHGAISGAMSFVATVGGALGPVLIGRIFDVTGSYQAGFYILAAFNAIGFLLALLSRPIKRSTPTDGLPR